MKKSVLILLFVAVAVTTVLATVSFDQNSGTGFIGRGDVISNAGKANLVDSPKITFTDFLNLSQDCEKDGVKKTIFHTFQRVRNINAQVQYDTRTAKGNGNITGYILNGYNGDQSPIPDTLCPTDWIADTPVQITSDSGPTLAFNGYTIPY
jgi:hypothetical protein